MSSPTLSHEHYTVAWICALPIEGTAATAMLDATHPQLSQPSTDQNTYTLGSISGHNVVIAFLPSGVYGTTSAATVATQLRGTFPSIHFALMVGIGGGVPNQNADVRLGDVVISRPSDTSGGVIQYDYGKTIHGGRFHPTGSLNKPPQLLLTAIAKMQSIGPMRQELFQSLISNAVKDNPNSFSRPNEDWLFRATYEHQDANANCSTCNPNQLVARTPRNTSGPCVHYGLIASGNQVMKDAQTRDRIAQERGILCFEMEAAGIMDQLPSLVIRGICDYCDSHKHKKWQGYASLTAAAYAKELLSIIPPSQERNQKSTPKRILMIPFGRNSRFVGRRDQITELEALIKQPDGPRRIAITGLGGVGKTQVVLELAYRVRDGNTACSIFWIPTISKASVEKAFMEIAQELGLHAKEPKDAIMQVKARLSHEDSGEWLLIFDNADEMDIWTQDDNAFRNALPPSERGHIVFTTRNQKLAGKLAASNIIPIPDMDQETAIQVLEKLLIHKDLLQRESKSATVLLEELAYLPLAISQAAAYINENSTSLTRYVQLLQEQETDVIELLSENFEDEGRYPQIQQHNPVATTWLISFKHVQQLNQLAADYLSYMACVHPRDIPHSLLPPGPSPKKQTEAVGLLAAYSFITRQFEDKFSLHRLVHLATRSWLRKENLLEEWVGRTATQLIMTFPIIDEVNRIPWRQYVPHAVFLIRHEEIQSENDQYGDLFFKIAKCLQYDGKYNEAEPLFRKSLYLFRKVREDVHDSDILMSMRWLSRTLQRQGRYQEAENLQVQVLEIRKQVLGPEHPDTLTSMSDLALTYSNQGQYQKAEELQVQVLEIRKQVLGPEHPDTLISINNLAATYYGQGKYQKAEELQVQVLEIRKQVLGPEHPETLTSMGNLALTYSNQGQYQKAEELEVWVLEISKQVLGPEHPDTLTSMNNLALTYYDQGQYQKAEELQVQVLEISKQVLGPEHPDTLKSLGNLASTYSDQGQYQKAEELQVQVLEIHKQVLGLEHPDTLKSMGNLAATYSGQGQYQKAGKLQVQVLQIHKQVLGLEHPDTLKSIGHLASTYSDQGQYQKAEELQVQVLEISKQVLGPEHPDTLISMNNLAYTWEYLGKHQAAIFLMTECVKLRTQHLGPNHPHTLRSIKILGIWNEVESSQGIVSETSSESIPRFAPKKRSAFRRFFKKLGKSK